MTSLLNMVKYCFLLLFLLEFSGARPDFWRSVAKGTPSVETANLASAFQGSSAFTESPLPWVVSTLPSRKPSGALTEQPYYGSSAYTPVESDSTTTQPPFYGSSASTLSPIPGFITTLSTPQLSGETTLKQPVYGSSAYNPAGSDSTATKQPFYGSSAFTLSPLPWFTTSLSTPNPSEETTSNQPLDGSTADTEGLLTGSTSSSTSSAPYLGGITTTPCSKACVHSKSDRGPRDVFFVYVPHWYFVNSPASHPKSVSGRDRLKFYYM